ncbi:hypothetical protein C8F01DRAFT_1080569 [Mycena amicta]|nr:hypothetical protein C8F01DRAFT_1080569 [Mycena amicta]
MHANSSAPSFNSWSAQNLALIASSLRAYSGWSRDALSDQYTNFPFGRYDLSTIGGPLWTAQGAAAWSFTMKYIVSSDERCWVLKFEGRQVASFSISRTVAAKLKNLAIDEKIVLWALQRSLEVHGRRAQLEMGEITDGTYLVPATGVFAIFPASPVVIRVLPDPNAFPAQTMREWPIGAYLCGAARCKQVFDAGRSSYGTNSSYTPGCPLPDSWIVINILTRSRRRGWRIARESTGLPVATTPQPRNDCEKPPSRSVTIVLVTVRRARQATRRQRLDAVLIYMEKRFRSIRRVPLPVAAVCSSAIRRGWAEGDLEAQSTGVAFMGQRKVASGSTDGSRQRALRYDGGGGQKGFRGEWVPEVDGLWNESGPTARRKQAQWPFRGRRVWYRPLALVLPARRKRQRLATGTRGRGRGRGAEGQESDEEHPQHELMQRQGESK